MFTSNTGISHFSIDNNLSGRDLNINLLYHCISAIPKTLDNHVIVAPNDRLEQTVLLTFLVQNKTVQTFFLDLLKYLDFSWM